MEHDLVLKGKKDRIAIVIPARYGSTRLPGKPLADIVGKPMVQHVYERARQVPGIHAVLVATDDARVAEAVKAFGGECVLTSPDHPSGTDRLAEVMANIDADIHISLQGDEPLVRPEDIAKLAAGMCEDVSVQVGTLCHHIAADEASNPNTVKVVLAASGDALYFSRSPIPFPRDAESATYLKHVGVCAYRREVLAGYAGLPQPMVEHAEKLEQLRLLAAGLRIRAFEVQPTGPGVDTPECLARVRALMAGEAPVLPTSLADVRLVITDVDGVLLRCHGRVPEALSCARRPGYPSARRERGARGGPFRTRLGNVAQARGGSGCVALSVWCQRQVFCLPCIDGGSWGHARAIRMHW